jgi:hypothetical protein
MKSGSIDIECGSAGINSARKHWFLSGLGRTLALWAAAGLLALGIGIAVGCMRTAKSLATQAPA